VGVGRGEQHEPFFEVTDQDSPSVSKCPSNPGNRDRVQLVVREESKLEFATEPHGPESPLEDPDPGFLAGESEYVLSSSGVPLDHIEPSTGESTGYPHAAHREHPHRTEREGEEPDIPPKKLSVTFPEMRTGTVLDGFSPPGQGKGGVNHDELGASGPDELEDLAVRMEDLGSNTAGTVHHAGAGVAAGGASQVEADHADPAARHC